MQITLAKALKLKARLAAQLSHQQNLVQTHNSRVSTKDPTINVNEKMALIDRIVSNLIDLKVAINAGNAGIQKDIYILGELKSRKSFISGIQTTHGKQFVGGYSNKIEVEYIAQMQETETTKLAEQLQVQIDETQDRIDEYNARTRINVSDEITELLKGTKAT